MRRGPHDATSVWIDGSKGNLAAPFAPLRLRLHVGPAGAAALRLVVVLHDPIEAAWSLWRGLADVTRDPKLRSLLAPYIGHANFTYRRVAHTPQRDPFGLRAGGACAPALTATSVPLTPQGSQGVRRALRLLRLVARCARRPVCSPIV